MTEEDLEIKVGVCKHRSKRLNEIVKINGRI